MTGRSPSSNAVKAPTRLFKAAAAALLAFALAAAATLAAATHANAADNAAIEYIPEENFTPHGYNWGINFTGVQVVKGFTEEADIAQFYPHEREDLVHDGDDGFAAFIGRSSKPGEFALRYTNGTCGNDKVDAVVTLADWTYLEPIMSDGTSGWDEYGERDEYDTFHPGVYVNNGYQRTGTLLENFNFYTLGLTDLKVTVEFFYAGTNDPYELKGHMTCIDLDVGQKFGFGGAVWLAQVVAENDFLQIDEANKMVISPTGPQGSVEDPTGGISSDPTDPLYKFGLVGAYYDTTASNRGVPVVLDFVTSWLGSASTAQSFFAMTNEFLTAPDPTDDTGIGKLLPQKTADKTEGVSIDDIVTYTVDVPVHERGVTCRNGYSYTNFEIVDVLPAEMRYVNGSGYLADEKGQRIANAGDVVYEGHGDSGTADNTVKFEFTRDYLANSMRMQGEHYRFVFKAVLTEYPADGSLQVYNNSYALLNNTGKYPSNQVETKLVEPEWLVTKTADRYECEVGDVISFTATFQQVKDNAQCRDSVFSDNLPEGMRLVEDSVAATGLKGLPEASIEGNRWSYSLDKFGFGDTLTVTYKAIALQSGNGYEQVNLAAAHANNCMDENDPAEVRVNTAKLSVEKTADYYEHYVGASDRDTGAVVYTVTTTNTKEGTVANNVRISDASLPEGLKVGRTNSGDLMVRVEGVPSTIAYPVGNEDSVHKQTENRTVTCRTEPDGTGFATTINHLEANVPITITYTCYPEDSVAGWEIDNTATATADNALPEKDVATIWVNQPGLSVEKQASLDSYSVGDLITYHLKVENDRPGTLGRNLVISDLMHTEGVELQRDSIKVWDSNGNDITESCTVHLNRNEPTFLVETHRSIVNASDERPYWDGSEESAKKGPNPLGESRETCLFVDYAVVVADTELAGKTIDNTAGAVTDEPNTQTTDDAQVVVKGANLRIQKTADKTSYRVGDTATYTLSVTQTRENAAAHSVVVKDAFDEAGLAAIEEGSLVATGPDGNEISVEPKYLRDEDGAIVGFSLETGCDLADEQAIVVSYKATMLEEHDRVGNKAQTLAPDALGSVDSHEVSVSGNAPAEASLEKKVSPEVLNVGDVATYTITARIGDADAKDVVISDKSLPEDIVPRFETLTTLANGDQIEPLSTAQAGNGFSLQLGDLAAHDEIEISFDSVVEGSQLVGQKVVNNAVLTSSSIEGERIADATVTIEGDQAEKPMPSIKKKAAPERAAVGEAVSYSIAVETGATALSRATLTDELDIDGAVIDYDTLTVLLDGKKLEAAYLKKKPASFELALGNLPANTQVNVEYETIMEEDSLAGERVENTATLASPSLDDAPQAKASVEVSAQAPTKTDVELTKTADREVYRIGDAIAFVISAKAVGGDVLQATLSDTNLPDGAPIDFDSIRIEKDGKLVAAPAIESDGNAFHVSLGDIREGSVVTVQFDARVEGENLAGTRFSNRATFTSPSLDDARTAHATVAVEGEVTYPGDTPSKTIAAASSNAKKGTLGKTGEGISGWLLGNWPLVVGFTGLTAGIAAIAFAAMRARKWRP